MSGYLLDTAICPVELGESRQMNRKAVALLVGTFATIFKTSEECAGKHLLTDITGATGGRTLTDSRSLPSMAATVKNCEVSTYRVFDPAMRPGICNTDQISLRRVRYSIGRIGCSRSTR